MKYIIIQRSEDGTGYYLGGRGSGWSSDRRDAMKYAHQRSAKRVARRINFDDKRVGYEVGPAIVKEAS